MSDLLLTLYTSHQRYVVVHQREYELRRVSPGHVWGHVDARGRPLLHAELGPLLLPDDYGSAVRRCALIVPLRRQSVALLCEAADDLRTIAVGALHALPPLLAGRLAQGWISGVYLSEDEPLLVLDLRLIALHVVRQNASIKQGESL